MTSTETTGTDMITNDMTITLIGYRGSGKSSVAPLLAEALGWDWCDADHEIESQAGCSIRQIFESEGEAGFRSRETEVLNQLLARPRSVIAAGGGAILADINRQRMQTAGPVVWLQANPETLAARIAGDQTSASRRPSLTSKSAVEEVTDVLHARTPLYEAAATMTVNADQRSPQEIVDEILTHLRTLQKAGGRV